MFMWFCHSEGYFACMKCAAADSSLYHSEMLDFRELSLFFIACKLQRPQKAQNVFNTWMTSLTLHGHSCQLSNGSRLHTLNVSFWSVTLIFYPSYNFFMFFPWSCQPLCYEFAWLMSCITTQTSVSTLVFNGSYLLIWSPTGLSFQFL